MKKRISIVALTLAASALVAMPAARSQDPPAKSPAAKENDPYAASTRTRVGQAAPLFTFTTVDGKNVKLADLRGKVVLLNFFATWCGPCRVELPRLEKDVLGHFPQEKLAVICIGREHTVDELKAFAKERKLDLPMAEDPERKIYSLYAEKYIPRTYIIDHEGVIAFQSVGFEEQEFRKMIRKLDRAVKRVPEAGEH